MYDFVYMGYCVYMIAEIVFLRPYICRVFTTYLPINK